MNTSSNYLSIAGIGTDLCQVKRIQQTYQRFSQAFLNRIFGAQEQAEFQRRYQRHKTVGYRYLATRFAAKEAFAKAVGTGMRQPLYWTGIQTLNDDVGRPYIALAPELEQWYQAQFGVLYVSISDESDLACAYVLVTRS